MEPTAISLPLVEVLKLLTTGLVATIAAQGIAWLIERAKSNRSTESEATYLAARLAVNFEQFRHQVCGADCRQ